MKTCPFCAEEIQDAATKCRFCGEWVEKPEPEPIGTQGYDVYLTTIGRNPKDVIQALEIVRQRGPQDAQRVISNPLPAQILSAVSAEVAIKARAIINGVGHGGGTEVRDTATGATVWSEHAGPLPHCPTCGSNNLQTITSADKVATAALVGIFALGKISKTFRCLNCGYQW